MKLKITNKPISEHINIDYKNYAIYTLQSRGIPSFDDSLTNVQRIILKNAPKGMEKTLSLVGSCISNGYAHGDSSLAGAIAKLTKPYVSSENMLEGKGFWGTPVIPLASAPRYTSLKMSSGVKKYMVYGHLDEQINEVYSPLHFLIPIGLCTMTTGIGVGYRSLILPRKLSDIEKFYEGKLKTVKPYFQKFQGKVSKSKDGWVVSGVYTVDAKTKIITIVDVPHIINYSSFLKKLYRAFENKNFTSKIINHSAKLINLKIQYKEEEYNEIIDVLEKNMKIIVHENIVFVHGNSVVKYNCIEDYLTDYQIRRKEILLKDELFHLRYNENELKYNQAKLDFLTYMIKQKRTRDEVITFLKKYETQIANRLDSIKLTKLQPETILETKEEIKRLISLIKKQTSQSKKTQKEFETLKKRFKFNGTVNMAQLNEEVTEEINGISVYAISEEDLEQLDVEQTESVEI